MTKLKEILNRIKKDFLGFCLAAVGVLVYYLIVHMRYGAFCPLLVTTGFPCAGCGLTRAALFLLQGDFTRAAYINPMIFPILVFLLYCAYFRYIKGTRIRGFQVLLIVLIVCMLLVYGVRMYLYFPDRVPYIYQKRNLLSELLPGYGERIAQLIKTIRNLRMNG